jgi:hypothetical protein
MTTVMLGADTEDIIVTYEISVNVCSTGASIHVGMIFGVISTVTFRSTSNGNSQFTEILNHYGASLVAHCD